MVTDTAPLSGKGVRYEAFGRSGVTAMVVEVLLGIGGFDVDRGGASRWTQSNHTRHGQPVETNAPDFISTSD